MMLTSDTAATVGVNNRADLQQNILGGAKYLAQVIDTIPKRIAEPDRTWLAVAAYNVGYGHLEDARVMAQMHGKNPAPGPMCASSCHCWHRSAGICAPSAATRAVGNRSSSWNRCDSIWRCWSGSEPTNRRITSARPVAPPQWLPRQSVYASCIDSVAQRCCAKKSSSNALLSSASTPPNTSTR